MPQSLANVLVQIVFSAKDRIPFLKDRIIRDELHAQVGGTSKSLNCPPIERHEIKYDERYACD